MYIDTIYMCTCINFVLFCFYSCIYWIMLYCCGSMVIVTTVLQLDSLVVLLCYDTLSTKLYVSLVTSSKADYS
jgi:hypothetical protein